MTEEEIKQLNNWHFELEGVLIDADITGFDNVCKETLRRIQFEICAINATVILI